MIALRLGHKSIRDCVPPRRQVAALAELIAALVPPPPAIRSQAEADAVRQFLLAAARGAEKTFPEDQPFAWRVVRRVWSRCPEAMRDERNAEAETTDPSMGRALRSG